MKTLLLFIMTCFLSTNAGAQGSLIEEITFSSHGVTLSGSVAVPQDKKPHSAVVFVHGSGKQSRNLHWAERFASAGIVALVYDKRGAGESGGEYESAQSVSEKNINLLADDAIAALNALRQHPEVKGLPIGLTGISQAGWIVPLAAAKAGTADFMVLWSAPVCKVSEEDIYSKYTSDLDGDEVPVYDEALRARETPYVWPDFLGKDSDPRDSLETLAIPGLWLFGENDGSVPVDLSIKSLKALTAADDRYDYVLFSYLGHNNMSETFAVATDWISRLPRKKSNVKQSP